MGETTLDVWRWVMDVNLWGVVHGCHHFLPLLKRSRGGLINVASAASFAAAPNMVAYNASKAAVLAVSETLAAKLAEDGVRVNVLCPTVLPTDIVNNARRHNSAMAGHLADTGDTAMRLAFTSADAVARLTLDRLDAGKLYTLPQPDAKLVWLTKRAFPSLYARGVGLLINRLI